MRAASDLAVKRSQFLSRLPWRRVSLTAGAAVALVLVVPPGAEAAAVPAQVLTKVAGSPLPTTERPDRVAEAVAAWTDGLGDAEAVAWAEALASGEPVEVEELTSEREIVYADPDAGGFVAELSPFPVRVRDDNDEWVDVDTTLVMGEDGTVRPIATSVGLEFSGGGDSGMLARIVDDGEWVELGWSGTLPEPELDGATATYRSVFPDVDLVMQAGVEEFNQFLLVHTPEAAADPRLQLIEFPIVTSSGIDVVDDEHSDGLVLVDASGDEVFAIPEPRMWDSGSDAESEGRLAGVDGLSAADSSDREVAVPDLVNEHPGARAAVMDIEVGEDVLQVIPDANLMTDPDVAYPIVLDPTVSRYHTYWRMIWNDGQSFANSYTGDARVGYDGWSSATKRSRVFYRFDISTFTNHSILEATLTHRQVHSPNHSCTASSFGPSVELSRSGAIDSSTSWSNQPSGSSSTYAFASTVHGHRDHCSGYTTTTWNAKAAAEYDASRGNNTLTIRLRSSDETDRNGWRHFKNVDGSAPRLRVVYNRPPKTPTNTYTTSPSTTCVTGSDRPRVNAASIRLRATFTDPDTADDLRGHFYWQKYVDSAWGAVSSANTSYGAHGERYYTVSGLTEGRYRWRARGYDRVDYGPYSGYCEFFIDTTPPSPPTFTCTNVTNGAWYSTRPASSTTCTFSSSSDTKEFDWKVNGSSKTPRTASSGSATSTSISIPTSGVTTIEARARDQAGNLSAWRTFRFGTGSPGITEPLANDRSTSTFPVDAAGPPDATGARIEWRRAGNATGSWTTASSVRLASTGAAWTGGVVQSGGTSTTRRLIWNAAADVTDAPALVQLRVCFTYSNLEFQCSQPHQVQLLPHAFGSSFPEDAAGPGRVALFTGEVQFSETDVEVPAYVGTLALSRSHRSLAGPVAGPTGVFGPGWAANLEGPDAGLGGFEVIDHTAQDGTIILLDPEGESYLYYHDSGSRGAQKTGTYIGLGETGLWEDTLKLTPGGTNGATHTLTITEDDGTKTIWERTSSGVWVTAAVIEPEQTGTTTYARNGAGLVTGIYAPAPSGVTCEAAQQTPGCRALTLHYVTVAGQQRLDRVDLVAYDPKPGTDGLPGAGAGMTTTTVARYSYDANGRLTASWDPRLGESLKTTYTYATVNGKTVVATVTPPGQQTWRFAHDTQGRLGTVKRAHDPAVGSGDATWTVAYGVALSGSGRPDLRPSATQTWGQPEEHAPTGAAGVFGPDRVPASTPTSSDWPYASLSYFTDAGRATNTAVYGAGAWQVTSAQYDEHGNEVRSLDAGNRAAALAAGGDTAAAADLLATITVYNEAGTRVQETYGPTREVVLDNGQSVTGRAKTVHIYDDEAAAHGIPTPGRPTPPEGSDSHNLVVEERTSVVDGMGEGASEWDVRRTRFRYDKVVASDGDGWLLSTPSRVSIDMGDGTWSTTLTRFDPEGKTIETRTPEGVAAVDGPGSDPRSTVTVYYTADGSAADPACRNRPEWAGLECRTGPAGQPASGPTLPVTYTTGFDLLLNATRVEERSGTTVRASTTTYDTAGRKASEHTTVTNPPAGDVPVPATSFGYDPSTGLLTTVAADGVTMTTGYDTWGRVVAQTDGYGNTATTGYDTAGRVSSVFDGKGTYTYSYDGTDAAGRTERRGHVTSTSVGLPGGQPSVFTAAYDADGNPETLVYPNGVTAVWERDPAGAETALTYTQGELQLLHNTHQVDAYGRVRHADVEGHEGGAGTEQIYHYDRRDRLVTVEDTVGGHCTTRVYGFSLDSNRTSLTTHEPGDDGECTTDTTPVVETSTFDDADRMIDAGYGYDTLGRTRSVPAGHTSDPDGSGLSIVYHVTDMVAALASTTGDGVAATKAFTLDPVGRLSQVTDTEDGAAVRRIRNHYASHAEDSDNPAWIAEELRDPDTGSWEQKWSRNITTPAGDLGLIQHDDGTTTVQLANLHGDITATMHNTTGVDWLDTYTEHTEYGAPRKVLDDHPRYGWLGAKQRSADTLAGLILMGVRLYNPTTGRFLTLDPIPGGNDNPYTYPADPINAYDLDGKAWWKRALKNRWVRAAATSVGIAAACAFSAGIGCAVVAGAVIGAGLRVANYHVNTRNRNARGYIGAGLRGAASGALAGAAGFLRARHVFHLRSKYRYSSIRRGTPIGRHARIRPRSFTGTLGWGRSVIRHRRHFGTWR